jgi:hypothetical protein
MVMAEPACLSATLRIYRCDDGTLALVNFIGEDRVELKYRLELVSSPKTGMSVAFHGNDVFDRMHRHEFEFAHIRFDADDHKRFAWWLERLLEAPAILTEEAEPTS